MTELAVKFKYNNSLQQVISQTVHLLFPLWGIIAPVIALLCLVALPITNYYQMTLPLTTTAIACLAFSLVTLRLAKYIDKDILSCDKSGIDLPTSLAHGFQSKRVPWGAIAKVEVYDTDNVDTARLAFFVADHPAAVLECKNLNTIDLEQLLLAVELWAPSGSVTEDLSAFKERIRNAGLLEDHQKDPGFTALWEEELRRRFRQVAFVPLEPGKTLRKGSLKVVRQLAMGGLSAIYLCQLDDREFVVLKEAVVPEGSPPELKAKADELFHREAELLMKIKHKNIVQVLDYFVEDGRDYLMLQYINGMSMRQYVKQNGRLRENKVIECAKDIAQVLQFLHSQDPPIIHRDITPDNLVLGEDGEIVVIDFGAANEYIGNSTGTFVGKQCYIPPEQFRGKASPKSDLYALGGTLFFLLTGEDPEALQSQHPKEKNESISQSLDDLVALCMEPEEEARIDSAETLLERLSMAASTL